MSETPSNSRSLWGDLDFSGNPIPDIVHDILSEQAKMLTQLSENVLRGKVQTTREHDYTRRRLLVAIPSLDYSVSVLSIADGPLMDHIEVHDDINQESNGIPRNDEQKLREAIGIVLSNEKVMRLLEHYYRSALAAAGESTRDADK